MSDIRDCMMFVTGAVGRSMGSGKFASSDLLELTRNAYAAFCDVFGKPVAPPAFQASQPPSAPQAPTRQAPSDGPQKPNWQAGAQAMADGGNGVAPETKSFQWWGGDKANLFGSPEKLWADWLGDAQSGDQKSIEALVKAARASVGTDPKWFQANTKRIARAKACLAMLGRDSEGHAQG